MMSCPGQPWPATCCQLLLFHPVIDIPRYLLGRIQGPEGPDNWYTGLSGTKGHGFPITVTLSPRPMLNTPGGTLLLE